MSIPVQLAELADAAADFGPVAYLLTSDEDGRPRVNQVKPAISADRVVVTVGRSASRNSAARPSVTLLWPPSASDGLTLLADGEAVVDGEPGPEVTIEVAVTAAVLHRRTFDDLG